VSLEQDQLVQLLYNFCRLCTFEHIHTDHSKGGYIPGSPFRSWPYIGIQSCSLDPFLPVIFGGNTKHCHWKLCTWNNKNSVARRHVNAMWLVCGLLRKVVLCKNCLGLVHGMKIMYGDSCGRQLLTFLMVLHVMQTAHFSVIAEARELTKLKVKVTHYKYNARILKLCGWLVEESAWYLYCWSV